MRRTMLALLALLPAAAATTAPTDAPAASTTFPKGEAVFRPECFRSLAQEEAGRFGAIGGSAGGMPSPTVATSGKSTNTGATRAKPRPQASPPPAMAPMPMEAEESVMAEPAADMAPMAPPAKQKAADAREAKKESAPKGATAGDGKMDLDLASGEDRARDDRPATAERERQGPTLDWGATVYLSNDDSMSLASAQRVLYSVMNGMGLSVPQIRPHELLNYFSFDTVTPDADQVFDVLASAEQDGDKLSVALAVKGATPVKQPLDLTLVVDRSCSMMDEGRMDYTRRGLTLMSDQLEKGDRVDIVLFDDAVCTPLENYVVGRDDPELLAKTIRLMEPEGSTDLDLGLKEGYRVAKAHADTHGRNRRMMLVTDALLNTGDVNPNTVSEIGKGFEADGIRLTGVGVGREFNDKVLDMLTEKGKGAYVFLGSEAVVDRVFGPHGFQSLTQTIAHDVQFALKLPPSLAMERFYGEEASTVKEDVQPVNYYAGTSQLFLQDLVIKNGKVVPNDPVELEITYRDAVTGEPAKRVFKTTVGKMVSTDPHNVQKGLALMAWTDLLMEQAMGGDPCGAPLDRYASRAAPLSDDAEVGFVNGLIRKQCGEFELPAVVSNKGVPFKVKVDADIPISSVALSCGRANWTETLTGSDAVARFEMATPGVCDLTLSGTVDMTARVEVPTTGGDLRCIVRGGRISCS